jgi:hypothetical protein
VKPLRDLVTVHEALRVGTLATILELVAEHFRIDRAALVEQVFGMR